MNNISHTGKCSKENVCWWVRQEIVRSLWRRNPSVRTLIKLIYLKKSQKIRASDGQTYDKCEFQVAKCKMFRDQGTILTRTYESGMQLSLRLLGMGQNLLGTRAGTMEKKSSYKNHKFCFSGPDEKRNPVRSYQHAEPNQELLGGRGR